MLRNLKSPETYFQAAFRVQSPWSIKNPNGDDPNEEEILKPVCFVFDFAPPRALRQLADYGMGLSPNESSPEEAVKDLVSFLPVLAYDGANMTQIDAGGILDIAMAGTSATLLARKWESALLVNVDNNTLRKILDTPEAMEADIGIPRLSRIYLQTVSLHLQLFTRLVLSILNPDFENRVSYFVLSTKRDLLVLPSRLVSNVCW